MLRGVSLFSGCGGSDLGAKRAGVDIIFSNDNYAPATRTYIQFKHLISNDNVDVRGCDIRKISQFPTCDILIGCYPCQSFTMGGNRTPNADSRSLLYQEFLRCLKQTSPRFFVAENVAGMQWLEGGRYLREQINAFSEAGLGYFVSLKLLDAKDYGVPADRKRIFLVGVRRDQGAYYSFPEPTHGPKSQNQIPYVSHGDTIQHLPLDCFNECYHPAREPFSWWFMSRNRKRSWNEPAYTVVSNWRHITLHPASPIMRMVESRWREGSKQHWEFTDQYDHIEDKPSQPKLEQPRRLSWRECALLQTFPPEFEPAGSVEAKYLQIGNAVPPLLMEHIIRNITSEAGLKEERVADYISPNTVLPHLQARQKSAEKSL